MDRSPFQLTGFPPNCLCATFPDTLRAARKLRPLADLTSPRHWPQHCISLGGASHWRYLSADRRLHRSNPQRCQARRPTSRLIEQVRAGHQHADSQDARAHRATIAPRYRRRGDRMSSRREFITLLGGAASWPLAARAQQGAMPVIGFLNSRSPGESTHLVVAFRQGLSETGYVEGQNVHVAFRWAEGRSARLPALATDLVEQRVAVIIANGPSALTAKAATATIPIVFLSGADPINAGLVTSFNRPRENLTGVSWFSAELGAKRLGLLHELVPKAAVFSLLVNPEEQQAGRQSADVQEAALSIGGQLHIVTASTEKEIDSAFAALVQQRTNAL